MRLAIPRRLIAGIAVVFSAFQVFLGIYSLAFVRNPGPVIAALAFYAIATTVSLLPFAPSRMPIWVAALNDGVVVAICLLASSQVDPERLTDNVHVTWYVAASGALMSITATRRRYGYAWTGIGFLVLITVAWSGPTALITFGVLGSITWVAVAQMIGRGMARASRDTLRFALAEREATEWQAMQEAHVHERQFRLGQTNSVALAMLRSIVDTGCELTAEQREECLHLEEAIRDEIRGRKLLNDAVRAEVMEARRRGMAVTLLDEGGLDELDSENLDRVLGQLGQAIHDARSDKLIARTVPEGATAITVVGLSSSGDSESDALGVDTDDTEMVLWLEIPRQAEVSV
jgi:hypothetical protein